MSNYPFLKKGIYSIFIGLVCGIGTLFTFQSCKDCSPIPQSSNDLICTLYRYDSLLDANTSNRVALDSTFQEVYVAGGSGPINISGDGTSYVFPLSNRTNQLTFLFNSGNGNRDTIQVRYLITAVPEGPDCGVYEEFNSIEVIHHTFDSLIVAKDVIESGDNVHFEVFDN